MDYEWENCMNYELDKCMRLLSFELFIFLLEYNRGKSYPSMLLRTVCQYGLVSSFTKERTTMTCQLVKLQQIYTWALATNKQKCRLGSELIVSNLYILETNPNPTFCLNDQANSLIHFYKRCVSLVIWRWLITKGPNGHHGTKELFPSENTISSVLWRKKFQGITISFVCQTVILPL